MRALLSFSSTPITTIVIRRYAVWNHLVFLLQSVVTSTQPGSAGFCQEIPRHGTCKNVMREWFCSQHRYPSR